MTFTLDQAMKAQAALRHAAGLSEETTVTLGAFVSLMSNEVELLRKAGKTDEDIAQLIKAASGADLTAQQIADNYALPEQRQHG